MRTQREEVIFLVHEEGGEADLFAYFPDIEEGKGLRLCYAHIGQHGACSEEYAGDSREATEEEFFPLLEELVSLGYHDMIVLNLLEAQDTRRNRFALALAAALLLLLILLFAFEAI